MSFEQHVRLQILVFLLFAIVAVAIFGCGQSDNTPNARAEERQAVALPTVVDGAPPAARRYRAELTRNARAVWGIAAPVPMFGAQIEAESSWDANAKSAYAGGLAQFTPSTADWIDGAYPELGEAQPFNPSWALRALVRYDKHLFDRVAGASECDRDAFALAGYNGGLKWVERDQAKAAVLGIDSARYWDAVEHVNAGRSAGAFTENRAYPRRIIRTLQPKYATWGRAICI